MNNTSREPRLPGMPGPTMDEIRAQTEVLESLEKITQQIAPMLQLVSTVSIEKTIGANKVRVTISRVKQ